MTQLDELICIYQCEMKRLIYLSVTDFLLLYKTGILWLYVGLTALYILICHHLPPSMIRPVSSVLIFSDPSASDLYFMGAVILLEKKSESQLLSFNHSCKSSGIHDIKILAFGTVSLCSGMMIAVNSGCSSLWNAVICLILSSIILH